MTVETESPSAPAEVPEPDVVLLSRLPDAERLTICSCCEQPRPRLVQLRVVGHQVAICGPCLRIMQAWTWAR